MGSQSDMDVMKKAEAILGDAGVKSEIAVSSAHRDP